MNRIKNIYSKEYILYYVLYIYILKGIYARFPLTGFDSIVKFSLTWSPFSYSVTLDAYHIDSVNTCYDNSSQNGRVRQQ